MPASKDHWKCRLICATRPRGSEMGHGAKYRYAHDEPDGYAAGENYFPEELGKRAYYRPVNRGLEQKIAEKLTYLKERDKASSG